MGKGQGPVLDMRFQGRSRSAQVLAALAALASWLMLAPPATADPNDNAYLSALAADGITDVRGPADLIQIGHGVCNDISPRVSPAMLEYDIVRGAPDRLLTGWNAPITTCQAGNIVHYAVLAYCPNSEGARYWGVRPYPPNPDNHPMDPGGPCARLSSC